MYCIHEEALSLDKEILALCREIKLQQQGVSRTDADKS